MYNAVRVRPGAGGWGKGLVLQPRGERTKVASITGGGIHPVAARIAELTGAEAVDGFSKGIPEKELLCVVIDCGGTARIGVYPMKKIPTIDVLPSSPSGPLSKYITEDVFVSGVGVKDVEPFSGSVEPAGEAAPVGGPTGPSPAEVAAAMGANGPKGKSNWLISVSKVIGYTVSVLYQSGRETIDMLIKNILPFMAFVSMLMGIITYTGLGKLLAHVLVPLAGTLGGLLVVVIVCTIPVFSPILGPGAVVAQIIGVLLGSQIAAKVIPVQYALPALFAIDGQVGCDFVPVGLALGEAAPETIEYGVPAVLYSRLFTGVIAVLLSFGASIGMYS